MLCRLSIGLLASAIAVAPLPSKAADGTAKDLGDVMSIRLQDAVKSTIADRCALQVVNAGSRIFVWPVYANSNDLITIGDSLSYDEDLDTRFSADVTWRFKTNGAHRNEQKQTNPAKVYLTSTTGYADVRLHDSNPCLIGMTPPPTLPPLPLPSLNE